MCEHSHIVTRFFLSIALTFFAGFCPAAEVFTSAGATNASARVADNFLSSIKAVSSIGPGQAGYIHYFLITHDDGSLEYHVGIELEDGRIAWSFPNAGVIVSEFVKDGSIDANGKFFDIEHLHGIRPFASNAQMRTLQRELPQRIAQWVDDGTPYCRSREPGDEFCLSCGDFAVRILYPGALPLYPALPRDFAPAPGAAFSTDDLLLYLAGIYNFPGKQEKLTRLATLDLPANMRRDIITIIEESEVDAPDDALALMPLPAKTTTSKPAQSRIATRRPLGKKL